jgi:hypothetical protein
MSEKSPIVAALSVLRGSAISAYSGRVTPFVQSSDDGGASESHSGRGAFGCHDRVDIFAVATPKFSLTGGLTCKCRHIPRSLGLHARLLQEAKIAKPIDKAHLPGSIRRVVAVCEPAAHTATIG